MGYADPPGIFSFLAPARDKPPSLCDKPPPLKPRSTLIAPALSIAWSKRHISMDL
jgi:hypothetical protein